MKQLLIGLALVTWTFSAMADDKSVGCGLGTMIAPKKTMVSAALRYVINTYTSATSAMTSGTSGCATHSIVKNEKRAIHFTEANYDALELEMAQGHGEFLNGMASVLGCEQGSFSKTTQSHFIQILPKNGKNPEMLLKNIQELIRTSPELAGTCQSSLT
jgi:hypothetical protein